MFFDEFRTRILSFPPCLKSRKALPPPHTSATIVVQAWDASRCLRRQYSNDALPPSSNECKKLKPQRLLNFCRPNGDSFRIPRSERPPFFPGKEAAAAASRKKNISLRFPLKLLSHIAYRVHLRTQFFSRENKVIPG